MTTIQTRMTIFAPLAALALWGSGLEAQAVGERVRASLADQTMVGEVAAVSEHGFQLGHEDGVDSILFGDLVKLERSVGQKSAWREGYVIGATILAYPGIQLIKTCLDDPTMGENAFLTTFCLIFLVAPGVCAGGRRRSHHRTHRSDNRRLQSHRRVGAGYGPRISASASAADPAGPDVRAPAARDRLSDSDMVSGGVV